MSNQIGVQPATNPLATIDRINNRIQELEQLITAQQNAATDIGPWARSKVIFKILQGDLAALRQSTAHLNDDTVRFRRLAYVTKLFNSSLDLEQVLTDVIDSVISFLGAQRAFLILLTDSQSSPDIRIGRNWAQETLSSDEISF